jgi:hypothetical protein
VLTANQPINNYWIRTVANGGTAGFDNGINSAILRYVGAAVVDPATNATTAVAPLVETNLHPLVAMPVPGTHAVGAADVTLNLVITLDFTTFTFRVNGVVGDFILHPSTQTDRMLCIGIRSPDGAGTAADSERCAYRGGAHAHWERVHPPPELRNRDLCSRRNSWSPAPLPLARRALSSCYSRRQALTSPTA